MIRLFGGRDTESAALLARAVALVYDAPLPAICRAAGGKPYFLKEPGWHFSLSDSGPYVLCALADRLVGVDIERVRPRATKLPAWALSADELAAWDGTWPAFYERWTEREAVGKCLGSGLLLPTRSYLRPAGMHVRHYHGADWVAAVACGADVMPEEIVWLE